MSGEQLPRTLAPLALDPNRKFGSLEEQTLFLARAFRARGSAFVPVFVAEPQGLVAERFRSEALEVEGLDLERFRVGSLRALLALVERHRAELIHWNFYPPLNPYLLGLSALRPGLRHLFTQHSSRSRPEVTHPSALNRRAKALLMRRHDAVLGVSEFVVRCLEEEGWWGRVGRFWHFVNLERFRPDPAARARVREELGSGEAFVAVVVAQLIPEKGVHVLIESTAQLPGDAQLWVVGEGAYRGELEALAARLGLERRVRFFGAQSAVERFLQAADVACCPSLWAEAAGLVNLEAAAAGLPSIATDIGGIPEYVRQGETGLLVAPGDVRALADALRALQADPARRRAMGAAARRFAEREFAVEETIERNLAAYRRRR